MLMPKKRNLRRVIESIAGSARDKTRDKTRVESVRLGVISGDESRFKPTENLKNQRRARDSTIGLL